MIDEYIEEYGYHFNKRLYEYAVSKMKDRTGNKVLPKTKEEVESFLKTNGVNLKNNVGWDAAYVYSMKYSDCWGSSIPNEKFLALSIMDFLDDPDGSKTKAFDHFVIDQRALREPIFWEDMM